MAAPALAALEGLGGPFLAQFACFAAALSYALAGTFGRRLREHPPLVTAAGQVTMSTLLILSLALLIARPRTLALPGPATWSALIGIALLSTAFAYVIYFPILDRAGATNLLLVTFLIPVSALALGIGFLGEHLATRHLGGMALVALGLAAMDGRPRAWLVRRRQSRPLQLRP